MAIVIAVVSSFIYTGSIAIQQVGNLPRRPPPRTIVLRLLTTPVWLLGFALGLVGFGLHFVALGLGVLDRGAGRPDVADHASCSRSALGRPRPRSSAAS